MFFVTITKSLLPIHSLFLQAKGKGNPLGSCSFLFKKRTKKSEMGNPKRRKCCAYLERIKKRTNIFKMSKRLV